MAASKAKTTAKPAAQVEEATDDRLEIGSKVKFLGYPPETPEEDKALTEGEVYELVGYTEPGDNPEEEPGGDPVLSFPNPDYNPKKKADPEKNPQMLEVQVFANEIELVDEEGEEEGEEEAEEVAAPAPAKTKGKAAAAPAKAEKAKEKAKPTKAAPAKAKKEKEAPAPEVDPLDEALEKEDEEVVALIEGSEDLVALAQELEGEAASKEWQLGGVLYHIRKDKTYHNVEGGEAYKETGGFEKFLNDYFNIEYRKAMYLIQIYVAFNLRQIENAAEEVAKMGWTKAKTIAPLMLKGGEAVDAGELVELANGNTVEDLKTAIIETVTVGATKTGGVRVKRMTLKFKYEENEAASINAILTAAKEQYGVKTLDEALATIINEWSLANGGKAVVKAAAPAQKAAAKKAAPAKAAAAAPAPAAPAKKAVARRVPATA